MQGKRETALGGRMPCGGPLFGYHYDPIAKTRTINEEQAAIVRLMFQKAFDGVSPYLIGVDVTDRGIRGPRGGVLEPRTVQRMLSNESYAGVDYYGLKRCIGSKGTEAVHHSPGPVGGHKDHRVHPSHCQPEVVRRCPEALQDETGQVFFQPVLLSDRIYQVYFL